jgi:uncharacterized protein
VNQLQRLISAICLVLLPATAVCQTEEQPRTQVVTMTGEATIRRAPDLGFVLVTVETRAANPQEAQRRNAQAMANVQEKLSGAGVPAENMRTVGFDLRHEIDWVDRRRVIRGYLAKNTIEVRVDRIQEIGALIDVAVAAGATEIGGVNFDLKDRLAAEREALRQAVRHALSRAQAAAEGAETSILRVLTIEEAAPMRPPVPLRMAAEAPAEGAFEVPIAPGELQIRATIRLTAELR